MKKLLLSAAVICLSTAAFSQNRGTTRFGVQIGNNLSTVTANLHTISDARVGFNAGVSAEQYFSESWSLKVKALYDQKGWRNGLAINTINGTSYSDNFNVDYLTIPVLANWHFGGSKNWFLNFGPYAGFLLNAKEKAQNTNFNDAFNSADIGLEVGIGIQFSVSAKNKLFIELDTESGLTELLKDNPETTIRNQVSSINVGFNF